MSESQNQFFRDGQSHASLYSNADLNEETNVNSGVSPSKTVDLAKLLSPDMLQDLKDRVSHIRSHFLEGAIHELLDQLLAPDESSNVENCTIEEPQNMQESSRIELIDVPRRQHTVGSLLDFLGEALRSSHYANLPATERDRYEEQMILNSSNELKSEVEQVLRLNSTAKEMQSSLQNAAKCILQEIATVCPSPPNEVALRLRRIEFPFIEFEKKLNDYVQDLVEDIHVDSVEPSNSSQFLMSNLVVSNDNVPDHSHADAIKSPNLEIHDSANFAVSERRYSDSKGGRFSKRAQRVLYDWLRSHFDHPYPSKAEKELLSAEAGISNKQLTQWFTNARRRIWKPFKKSLEKSVETTVGGSQDDNLVKASSSNSFDSERSDSTVLNEGNVS